MLKYNYECDGGSILIGNDDFAASFPNDYGDGWHSITIAQRGDTISDFDPAEWNIVGSVQGRIHVFCYDCLNAAERSCNANQLCVLVGRYGVFARKNSGDMLLEFWDYDD